MRRPAPTSSGRSSWPGWRAWRRSTRPRSPSERRRVHRRRDHPGGRPRAPADVELASVASARDKQGMSDPNASTHHFQSRLVWTGAEQGGTTSYEAYSRRYRVDIEGKPSIVGSAAPPFLGDGSLHNPEDMLMVALSACHCLSYLALCARSR